MDKKRIVDLTEGEIWKQLLKFVWPILVANIFQQLYNITNSMIVGNLMDTNALGAVSAAGSISILTGYFFYGIATAAGILVSNYFGSKDSANVQKTVQTSLIFAVGLGILLTVLGELFVPALLKYVNVRESIYRNAEIYMRIFLIGVTFQFIYNMSFFIMRSIGDSRHPLFFLIISCIVNICLGYSFVKWFHMGVAGVAWATNIAQLLVDILALNALFRMDNSFRVDLRNISLDMHIVKRLLSLGIPASLQNMLIGISNVVVSSYVNLFSNQFIAGIGVAEKVANWAQIPMQAISTIGTNYVGQNMGARKYDRVQKGIRMCILIGTAITLVCALAIFFNAEFFVGLFDRDPEVVKYGAAMTRYTVFAFVPLTWSHIYNGSCRGAGNVRIPMIVAVFTQCVCRYVFVYFGLKVMFDERIIYMSSAVVFTLAGICAALYFNFSKWTKEAHLRP